MANQEGEMERGGGADMVEEKEVQIKKWSDATEGGSESMKGNNNIIQMKKVSGEVRTDFLVANTSDM